MGLCEKVQSNRRNNERGQLRQKAALAALFSERCVTGSHPFTYKPNYFHKIGSEGEHLETENAASTIRSMVKMTVHSRPTLKNEPVDI